MGRHSSNPSYGHRIAQLGRDWYRLSWRQDRYYTGSRLRHPRVYSRDADEKGARRFAKKWNIQMPDEGTS